MTIPDLERLQAESLENISRTQGPQQRRLQDDIDCTVEAEVACVAEAACEPEAALCAGGIAEPESTAECTARLSGISAGAEPAACEPSPTTGCAWLVTPESAASCKPATPETPTFCSAEAEPACNGWKPGVQVV